MPRYFISDVCSLHAPHIGPKKPVQNVNLHTSKDAGINARTCACVCMCALIHARRCELFKSAGGCRARMRSGAFLFTALREGEGALCEGEGALRAHCTLCLRSMIFTTKLRMVSMGHLKKTPARKS